MTRRLCVSFACVLAALAFPVAAGATVSGLSANLETGDFSQFNMGAQTARSGASISIDTRKSYDGSHSAHASYADRGANNFARGVEAVSWNDGADVWFGEAIYLSVGFKAAMQGQVALVRWDDWPSYASGVDPCGTLGGLVIFGSDKRARFVNNSYACPALTKELVGSFNIPEGQWVWFDIHMHFSEKDGSALTRVYMNGAPVGSSKLANKGPYPIRRVRYGIVAIASGAQMNPLSLWFDRAYVAASQLHPLSVRCSRAALARHRARRRCRAGRTGPRHARRRQHRHAITVTQHGAE
jgi:hypothetical protein